MEKGVGAEDGLQRKVDLAKQNKICFVVAYLRSAIEPKSYGLFGSLFCWTSGATAVFNGCSFYYTM